MGEKEWASLLCNPLSSASTCCSGLTAGNFSSRHNPANRARVGVIIAILSSGPGECAQLVWRRVSHLHSVVQRTDNCRFPCCWTAWQPMQVTADLSFCAFHVGSAVECWFMLQLQRPHISKCISASYLVQRNM